MRTAHLACSKSLCAVAFPRIAGGKPFDITRSWFTALMDELGQKVEPAETAPEH